MDRQTFSLLLVTVCVAVCGCGTDQKPVAKPSPVNWEVAYFDLSDRYQAIDQPSHRSGSILEGRIETIETRLRPLDENGESLPCITYREGQFVEANTGKSFPVHVDAQAGLFQYLEPADGQIVRLHLTEETADRSVRIGHHNVSAIEVAK